MTATAASPAAPPVLAEDWASSELVLNAILAKAFDPGEAMRIDVWAEKSISLPPEEGRLSGRFSFSNTPYMRGALILAAHSRYRRTMFLWGAQTGKTLAVLIYIAYIIAQRPARTLYVGPDKKFVKIKSRSHFQPFIRVNPVLQQHTTGRREDIQNFEMRFDRMALTFGWAGSPSTLAGESVQDLARDEIGKFKQRDKDEGDPLDLSARRIIAFGELGHIFDVTTPSTTEHESWADYQKSSCHHRWIPCPHCGKPDDVADIVDPVIDCDVEQVHARLKAAGYQVLEFAQVKGFSGLRKSEEIKRAAYYECAYCRQRIDHRLVIQQDLLGKWVPNVSGCEIAGLRLPSWYRGITTMSFAEAAARFINTLGKPEKLKEWKTHDEAVAYEDQGEVKTVGQILALKRDYPPGHIPFIPLAVLMAVDVRSPELHVEIKAFGEYETTALLRYDITPRLPMGAQVDTEPTGETLAGLDHFLDLTFPGPDGRQYGVDLCGIDSGWDADEVYAFCRKRRGCVALKAEYGQIDTIRYSRPDKMPGTTQERPDSCYLFAWQHKYFADIWSAKLKVTKGSPGEVMLHRDTGEDYGIHQSSEAKKTKRQKNGRFTLEWVRVTGSPPNHFLDTSRMLIVLSRYLQIPDKRLPPELQAVQEHVEPPASILHRDFSNFTGRLQQ